ncbi:MAG: HAD family hydrolase [Gammaproteobacteria bacterium]|nr:HAD family hydrolase [Gammaproteobacteria bacterium]
MLQGLIFDVDGTLADTEEIHRLAFNQTFTDFGLDWNWNPDLYEELLVTSGGKERITQYAKAFEPERAATPDFSDFVRRLHNQKTALYAEMLTSGHIRLRPGVERLLHAARSAGLTLGIATSSAWSNAKALLDNNLGRNWQSWFAAIETSDTVTEKKPAPAVYQAVLDRLRLAPKHCIAIEDTENGLAAARAAGLATVITTHRFTRNRRFMGAALVLDGLGEPDQPMTVTRGSIKRPYVDLAFLERVLADYKDVGSSTYWEQQLLVLA